MYELIFYIIILSISIIFYLIIPSIGALNAIRKWRQFRMNILNYTNFPIINYGRLNSLNPHSINAFRFFGKLEALQGKKSIWVKNNSLTLKVDLSKSRIYFLPSVEDEGDQSNNYSVNQESSPNKWQKIYSLSEGTQVFIAGACKNSGGQGLFYETAKYPLMAVFYNGKNHELIKRIFYGARQKNEYWNTLTPFSLILGFTLLIVFSYTLATSTPYSYFALFSLCMSLFPLTLLLPPGIFLFWLFQYFWNQSRNYRSQRDLFGIPLSQFKQNTDWKTQHFYDTKLPGGENYRAIKLAQEKINEYLVSESPDMLDQDTKSSPQFIFGQSIKVGTYLKLKRPDDPMAIFLKMNGYPKNKIENYQYKSKMNALWGILSLIAAILINLGCIFLILQFII